MLKPVSIIALDAHAAALAGAVRDRVTEHSGHPDLVQVRALTAAGGHVRYTPEVAAVAAASAITALPPYTDLAAALSAVREVWQSPDSSLRSNESILKREIVLLVASAAAPGSHLLLDLAEQVRQLYDTLSSLNPYSLEALCLLPDLFEETVPADYGTAYSLLKLLSDAMGESSVTGLPVSPFKSVHLLSSTNASGVRFGKLARNLEIYASAVAGMLTVEPEMSGPGTVGFKARGMDPTFSSFGYAELLFPRELVTERVSARMASELVGDGLLGVDKNPSPVLPRIEATAFVGQDSFTLPLQRLGVDGGQQIWTSFVSKTTLGEDDKIDPKIASLRQEAEAFNTSALVEMKRRVAVQGQETAEGLQDLLSGAVDDVLDGHDYPTAVRFLESLIQPSPELYTQVGEQTPRNLITELVSANRALDKRLDLKPNQQRSTELAKKIRQLADQIADQKLASEILSPQNMAADDEEHAAAAEQAQEALEERAATTAELETERLAALAEHPVAWWDEEKANSRARTAAKEAMHARLAEEVATIEGGLRDLEAQRPKAQDALDAAMAKRREFLNKYVIGWPALALAVLIGIPLLGWAAEIEPIVKFVRWVGERWDTFLFWGFIAAAAYSLVVFLKYRSEIWPELSQARAWVKRIFPQMQTDFGRLKRAHDAALQFEYDLTLRETTVRILKNLLGAVRETRDKLNAREQELQALGAAFAERYQSAAIAESGLTIPAVGDGEVDGWYDREIGDREALLRVFLTGHVKRSDSRHEPIEELGRRITAFAAERFKRLQSITLAQVVAGQAAMAQPQLLSQRLKRMADFCAPLIEVKDGDQAVQTTMQRDTTVWLDERELPAFVNAMKSRFVDAGVRPHHDSLRARALGRVLNFPAYAMAQVDFYRGQYDPAKNERSAMIADLVPAEFALTPAVRAVYEHVVLARAVGLIRIRDDGRYVGSDEEVLGQSHIEIARKLASSEGITRRKQLVAALQPRLSATEEIGAGLRTLLDVPESLTKIDQYVIKSLMRRYGEPV